ncbi:unnamed protein product [Rotaria sp. Silwood1]|nr:unnamed protein product [Rotaria sp. Silwood1]
MFSNKIESNFQLNCIQDQYFIRVYNVDDQAKAVVNQHNVIALNYSQSSSYINVTAYLNIGMNSFTFTEFNYGGGYTWGFEIRKNNDTIFNDEAGTTGVIGANDNDSSKTNQYVYNRTVTIDVMCS